MLTLIQGYKNMKTRGKEKRKRLRQVPCLFFFPILMEFGMLFTLFFFYYFFFFAEEPHNISSHPIKIEGEIPTLVIKMKKKKKSWLPFRHLQTNLFQSRNNER